MIKLRNNVTRKMLPFRLTNANNLPLCHRLKPNGNNLIVQKCELKAIEVTARLKKVWLRTGISELHHWKRRILVPPILRMLLEGWAS